MALRGPRKIREFRHDDALVVTRAIFDKRCRRRRRKPGRREAIANRDKFRDTHVEGQRLAGSRKTGPVDCINGLAAMRSHELNALGMITVGQRNTRIGGAGERGGDARHDIEGDTMALQVFEFLASPAEHEGIAAFQAHDPPASPRFGYQHAVDAVLPCAMTTRRLANVDDLGIKARARQDLW